MKLRRPYLTSISPVLALLVAGNGWAQAPATAPLSPVAAPVAAPAPVDSSGAAAPLPPAAAEPLEFEQELSTFMQPGGLTSVTVAERAVKTSARVEAKQAAVTTAQKQADAVLGQFYPKLTGTARYTRLSEISVPPEFQFFVPPFNQYALQATLTIPVSDYILRLSTALSGASKNEDSAKLNARAERLIVQTDAKVAYYTWVKAQGALYVATKSKEQVDASLRDVQQSFQMGVASKADVLRTEALVYGRELMLLRAQQAVQVATENLRASMGAPETESYTVGEQILRDIEAPNMPTQDAAYDEAVSKRLELRALVKLEEATKDQASLAKVAYYPRLDLQGNALYANPNQRIFPYNDTWHGTWDASVVLSWTPTDIPQAMGESGTATARAAEIAAQRRAMEIGLRVEVAQALGDMKTSLASVQTTREALKSSEEGFRVRNELFKAGRATTLEVTDAQNALTQARLEVVFAHADARIARDRLAHALGRDVPAETDEEKQE